MTVSKLSRWITLTITGVMCAGCIVTSVQPFYRDQDVVFDPALMGRWETPDTSESWVFEQEGTNSYTVTYVENERTNIMSARLFTLGKHRLLNFCSNAEEDNARVPPGIPTHMVMRVTASKPRLVMSTLKHEATLDFVKANPRFIRYYLAPTGDQPDQVRVVFTDNTPKLQRFLRKALKEDDAWEESIELTRRSD